MPAEAVDLVPVELGGGPEPYLACPGHQAPAQGIAVAVEERLAAEPAGTAVEQEVLHLLVEDELSRGRASFSTRSGSRDEAKVVAELDQRLLRSPMEKKRLMMDAIWLGCRPPE